MSKTSVFCIAKTESQAIRIVDRLKDSNFSSNDISVLFPDKTGTKDFAHEQHTKAPEGAATGGVTGGVPESRQSRSNAYSADPSSAMVDRAVDVRSAVRLSESSCTPAAST